MSRSSATKVSIASLVNVGDRDRGGVTPVAVAIDGQDIRAAAGHGQLDFIVVRGVEVGHGALDEQVNCTDVVTAPGVGPLR